MLVLVACSEEHERADASVDAARGSDASTTECDEMLGAACEDPSACGGELQCESGRCMVGRAGCGGFAGALCEGALECLYFTSADYGACVTSAERECLCARARASFSGCE
ncbi:Hypothetical protein I5071_59820 [Sandaracinus amylolyticus]|nr:Hypothetical protein I5071_59820 [Sandaracinus amylolyticus]